MMNALNMQRYRDASALAITVLIGLSTPGLGRAQSTAQNDTLEEILVTAERREENLQRTAASVSVRKGDELAAEGRYTTRQILEDVPGITALGDPAFATTSTDVQGNNITIRGITSASVNVVSNVSGVAPTAVYTDGVYEGIGGNYDIDRVEVLRGPQGTLYGRSATAGVVSTHTRNPTFDAVGGDVSAEFGNYALQHYSGALNAPVNDTFALRLAADYRKQGAGYYGIAQYINDATSGRVKALWKPTDSFSLLLGVAAEQRHTHTGGRNAVATPPGPTIVESENPVAPGETHSRQYWAELNWDLGAAILTYQPAYRSWVENDTVLPGVTNFIGSGAYIAQVAQTPRDKFITHELRLASNNDSRLRWQTGVFYYDNKLKTMNFNWLYYADGTQAGSILAAQNERRTQDIGIFGEGTLTLTDATRLTVGVRYDDTKVTVSELYSSNRNVYCGGALAFLVPNPAACTGPGLPIDDAIYSLDNAKVTFHNFNYKVRLEHDLTPQNMLYAMISTGFRPGDMNVAGDPGNGVPLYANSVEPEKLTAFEVGSKNRFLDDRLQTNVSVYFYRYRGFLTTYTPNTTAICDPCSPGGGKNVSAPANSLGGELELLYQLTERDRLGFSYSYAQSRWVDRDPAFAAAVPQSDRAIMPHLLTASYDHRFTLPGDSTLTAGVDGRYIPAYYTTYWHTDYLAFGFDPYGKTDNQTLFNLTGTWASPRDRYSVSGYVRNVFDKHSIANGGYAVPNVISTNPLIFEFDKVGRTDPRTYGVVLSIRF